VLAMEISGRYEKIFSRIYLLKDKEMLGDCSFIQPEEVWWILSDFFRHLEYE
jgi:hypothetical protein